MSQFNKIPPKIETNAQEGLSIRDTIRQWFHYKELPTPRISPPLRANTTAFKYWLYRFAYTVAWLVVYTAIIRIPGVREPIPAIIEILTSHSGFANLNLTNGVVVAFVIILITRVPPFKGMDATFRLAMYERASIPAQQLGFQYLLHDATYAPDAKLVERVRKALVADGFASQDINLDPDPTTRSMWTKTCIMMKYVERWGKDDHYKTALALLREPGSDKLSAEHVRSDFEALKSDARVCLSELTMKPDAEQTRLRDQQFRRDCKAMLESIYSLLTHVALRSHYSYFDAIASVKNIGFVTDGSVAPLSDKNDIVALSMMLFIVTTIPLAYRIGLSRAVTITGIYILAVLTPIYLAAECPRLLKSTYGRLPPLAFPLAAGLIAGILAALVSIVMGGTSIGIGGDSPQFLSIERGIDRLVHKSYPWIFLQSFLTMMLAALMLFGKYANPQPMFFQRSL